MDFYGEKDVKMLEFAYWNLSVVTTKIKLIREATRGETDRDMAENEERRQTRVCVTGAGGYIGSWIVKSLLSRGYLVHGTVRDPCDDKKNGHLKTLEAASENLHLFKADLFDSEGLSVAIAGCTGVIHVASPIADSSISNPQVELLEPAVTGTRNVLDACLMAKVKKVMVISSLGAVWYNPNWPEDQPMDETCWTDMEFCKSEIARESKSLYLGFDKGALMWYCLGKTMAEQEALEFGRRNGINIVTICPSLVLGPMLHSTNSSTGLFFMDFLKGGSVEDARVPVVDVRDVAEAALLVYENPESEGRYICTSYDITPKGLVEQIQKLNIISNYNNYPKEFTEVEEEKRTYSSKKLQDLGWKYRELDETIVEEIRNLFKLGLLPKP